MEKYFEPNQLITYYHNLIIFLKLKKDKENKMMHINLTLFYLFTTFFLFNTTKNHY